MSDSRIRLIGGPADGQETEIPCALEIVEMIEGRQGFGFQVRTGIPFDNLEGRTLYRRSIVDPAAYVFQP